MSSTDVVTNVLGIIGQALSLLLPSLPTLLAGVGVPEKVVSKIEDGVLAAAPLGGLLNDVAALVGSAGRRLTDEEVERLLASYDAAREDLRRAIEEARTARQT